MRSVAYCTFLLLGLTLWQPAHSENEGTDPVVRRDLAVYAPSSPIPWPTIYIPPTPAHPTPWPTIYIPPTPAHPTPWPTIYIPPTPAHPTPWPTIYIPPTPAHPTYWPTRYAPTPSHPTPWPTIYIPPTPAHPTPWPTIYIPPTPAHPTYWPTRYAPTPSHPTPWPTIYIPPTPAHPTPWPTIYIPPTPAHPTYWPTRYVPPTPSHPTRYPTQSPTPPHAPHWWPTPSHPTRYPTQSPTPSHAPHWWPTPSHPTQYPTQSPTPSHAPHWWPTRRPTRRPARRPTKKKPTMAPTMSFMCSKEILFNMDLSQSTKKKWVREQMSENLRSSLDVWFEMDGSGEQRYPMMMKAGLSIFNDRLDHYIVTTDPDAINGTAISERFDKSSSAWEWNTYAWSLFEELVAMKSELVNSGRIGPDGENLFVVQSTDGRAYFKGNKKSRKEAVTQYGLPKSKAQNPATTGMAIQEVVMEAFRDVYPKAKVFGIASRRMKPKYADMTFDEYIEFTADRFGKKKRNRDGNGVTWDSVTEWMEAMTAEYICAPDYEVPNY